MMKILLVKIGFCIYFLTSSFGYSDTTKVAKGVDVREVQTILTELCFNPGPIDGVWGKKTEKAAEEFFTKYFTKYGGYFGHMELKMLQALYRNGVVGGKNLNRCSGTPQKKVQIADKDVKVVDAISIYSQSDIDKNFKNKNAVTIDKMWIKKSGIYDFYNINFSYSGKDKRCKKSRDGFVPFIIIDGKNVHIKNLVVKKSAPDGIEIRPNNNAKFENLKLLHSCDEGFQVRPYAKIELINSKIISQYNKGIQFDSNNQAKIVNSEIISEQALTLNNKNLDVTIDNSIIKKHPNSRFGRLISGSNCGDIMIKHTNTKFIGIKQLIGTRNCSNIKIVKK